MFIHYSEWKLTPKNSLNKKMARKLKLIKTYNVLIEKKRKKLKINKSSKNLNNKSKIKEKK